MNQKGFAISTILYGLVLLTSVILFLFLGTLSFSADNNKKLASDVEKQLNTCYTDGKCTISSAKASESEWGNPNIKAVYKYDPDSNYSTRCITGEEWACELIYPVVYEKGTIVEYEVKKNVTRYFYVISDDGDTLTMQQRGNTIGTVKWGTKEEGPIDALTKLKEATKDWVNVEDLDSKISTLGMTKARMITKEEATSVGCREGYENVKTCPLWMNNYLNGVADQYYGGTNNEGYEAADGNGYSSSKYYWTMDKASDSTAYMISYVGSLLTTTMDIDAAGYQPAARAVVVIKK